MADTNTLIIRDFMSPEPVTLALHETAAAAKALMEEMNIRHVPVLDGGRVVGVMSDRDLQVLQTIPAINIERLPLEELANPDFFTVASDTSLRDVAMEMAEKKYGCVLVMDGEKLVGIFSTTDLARAIVELVSE